MMYLEEKLSEPRTKTGLPDLPNGYFFRVKKASIQIRKGWRWFSISVQSETYETRRFNWDKARYITTPLVNTRHNVQHRAQQVKYQWDRETGEQREKKAAKIALRALTGDYPPKSLYKDESYKVPSL